MTTSTHRTTDGLLSRYLGASLEAATFRTVAGAVVILAVLALLIRLI